MPRTPTTLCIVPSRLALGLQAGLAFGVAGLVVGFASSWAAAVAVACLGAVVARIARDRPAGELQATPRDDGGIRWRWRETSALPWREARVRCDYLGPWLIGLRVDGRRLWLWPDSGDPAALRALRREFVAFL